MKKLLRDESGFVVSSELVLVLTIAVLGMVVGLTAVRDSLSQEMVDLSNAFGAVNQTYNVAGVSKPKNGGKAHGAIAGFGYNDNADDCDCIGLTITDVCGKLDPSNGAPNEGNGGGGGAVGGAVLGGGVGGAGGVVGGGTAGTGGVVGGTGGVGGNAGN